jgi:hypothetical protein
MLIQIYEDMLWFTIIATIQNFFLESWEGTQQIKYMTSL